MKNMWSDSHAQNMIKHYAEQGVDEDLALRVYTTRLLGQNPELVLHGGGNTSVKARKEDMLGEKVGVICVKGSGWDMADIEPPGLPAVRLSPLLKLSKIESLTDDRMVSYLRSNLIDASSPNPSVETLLHAFLPHKFVDHTHAVPVLSLTNQPNGEELCKKTLGDRVGIVPYVMPGFPLSKIAETVFKRNPDVEGLILIKHGIFTFGETAVEAYERMINLVTLVEKRLEQGHKQVFQVVELPTRILPASEVGPILRGACKVDESNNDAAQKPFVLKFRTSPDILSYVNGTDLSRYSQSGVATPDHTIRTKNWPLLVPAPNAENVDSFKRAVADATSRFMERYRDYFRRHSSRYPNTLIALDPIPRVVLVPGLGLYGLGKSTKAARVSADIAESAVRTITDAEAIGIFESISEEEMFDVEYWSLEQAKLGKAAEKPLAGYVVVVTGGGGTIGSAIGLAFGQEGAEVALLDVDVDTVHREAASISPTAIGIECNVTDEASVRSAFDRVCEAFGGVDIVVSNAGAAWQGRIGEIDQSTLRESFELNFFSHQTVAQNAVRIMRAQGMGGTLLFNVSKQAVNPGANFGPYGLPKAATLFLSRQYAVDYGQDGIRSNAVNADHIRSGMLTPELISARAKARGVSESEYMEGNLLGLEVTAADVAKAFVHQALQTKSTANVTTVDGGNIEAALR